MSATATLPRATVLAYGVLGLPLAFAALPIYVHVPKLYADALGMPLAIVGAVLLGARVVDALADPLIGWASDRIGGRRRLIAWGLAPLLVGVIALLRPPEAAGAWWLLMALTVAYAGYSLANINYQAWGARMAPTPTDRTRVVAAREGFGLLGVVLAAALPAWLADDPADGMGRLSLVFLPLVLIAAVITLGGVGRDERGSSASTPWRRALAVALARPAFMRLLAVFAISGIAAAVPATTVLFYVDDVIAQPASAGLFLATYFIAGGLSLPLWVSASRRMGKLRAWLLAMLCSIVAFGWAATLGAGDAAAFWVICVASGLALGADLTLPPAILADQLTHNENGAGACFGWWNFVTKANLALAAGVALPLLAALGYTPGSRDGDALVALAVVYGGLPVALKSIAAMCLWRWRDQIGETR